MTTEVEDFWAEKLYDAEWEPVSRQAWVTYSVHPPRRSEVPTGRNFNIYVDVEDTGLISLNESTYWMGKSLRTMSFDERRELYEYLVEWELAQWFKIGPEDSELFATEKLIGTTLDAWGENHNWYTQRT